MRACTVTTSASWVTSCNWVTLARFSAISSFIFLTDNPHLSIEVPSTLRTPNSLAASVLDTTILPCSSATNKGEGYCFKNEIISSESTVTARMGVLLFGKNGIAIVNLYTLKLLIS